MKVLYALAVFDDAERRAVNEVLATSQIVAGRRAAEFEKRVARLFGKKFGVLVNSGSSANLLALEILKLPAGTEVITPALTFSTTLAPIIQRGLMPALVDAELGSYTLKINQVERLINKKTKVLMVPSLLGNIPDLPRLRKIANKRKLILIEDSCDTLGAVIGRRPTGFYSDISTTSFYASHIITAAGQGGMLCVNNPKWYRQARVLSGWGRQSSLDESESLEQRFSTKLAGVVHDAKFIFEAIGYNFRTTDIVAAFGLAQLAKLERFAKIRRHNFESLRNHFRHYEQFFILPKELPGVKTNWLAFPLTIKTDAPFSRHELVHYLEKNNIQTRPIFSGNILRHPGFKNIRRRELTGGHPNADLVMRNGFVVGCHHGLEPKHLEYLKKTFTAFLEKY